MSCSILELAGGKAGFGREVGKVMKGMSVDFGNASTEEGADEELETLEFGLDDYEAEVGFRICISRLLFHELNLVDKLCISPMRSVRGSGRCTCLLILSRIRSIKAFGHGSISGALRSVTHARVSSCRSRVSRGMAWLSTSAKMSSISIEFAVLPSLTGPPDQKSQHRTVPNLLNEN